MSLSNLEVRCGASVLPFEIQVNKPLLPQLKSSISQLENLNLTVKLSILFLVKKRIDAFGSAPELTMSLFNDSFDSIKYLLGMEVRSLDPIKPAYRFAENIQSDQSETIAGIKIQTEFKNPDYRLIINNLLNSTIDHFKKE